MNASAYYKPVIHICILILTKKLFTASLRPLSAHNNFLSRCVIRTPKIRLPVVNNIVNVLLGRDFYLLVTRL